MPRNIDCIFFKKGVCNHFNRVSSCFEIVNLGAICSEKVENKKPAPPPAPPKPKK
jgi:hypothetical protein